MCKTWSIKYSCSHTFYFHLSRCRGTISTGRRAPFTTINSCTTPTNNNHNVFSKPACSATPTLTICPKSLCGPCQRADLEAASEAKVEDARARAQRGESEGHDDLARLLDERERLLFCLTRRFPVSQQFKEFQRPESGRRARELGGSRLRVVVSAADQDEDATWAGEGDVEDESESRETQAYLDDWACCWSTEPSDPLPPPTSAAEDKEVDEAEGGWDAGPERKENAKPSTIRDKECKALVAWSGQLQHGLTSPSSKVAPDAGEPDVDVLNRFRFVLLGVTVGS